MTLEQELRTLLHGMKSMTLNPEDVQAISFPEHCNMFIGGRHNGTMAVIEAVEAVLAKHSSKSL